MIGKKKIHEKKIKRKVDEGQCGVNFRNEEKLINCRFILHASNVTSIVAY